MREGSCRSCCTLIFIKQLLNPWLFYGLASLLLFLLGSDLSAQTNSQQQRQADERLGIQYFQHRQFKEASDLFAGLFEPAFQPYIYNFYFLSLTEQKRYKEAVKVTKQMVKKYPNEYRYLADLVYIALQLGDQDEAKEIESEALKKMKKDPKEAPNLANSYRARLLNSQALAVYQALRDQSGNQNLYLLETASVNEIDGNFQGALDTYIKLLESDSKQLSTIQMRLQFSLAQDLTGERMPMVKKSLIKAIQKKPDLRSFSELMYWVCMQEKDFLSAFTQAKAIDSRFDKSGALPYELARIAYQAEDFKAATLAYKYVADVYKDQEIGWVSENQLVLIEFEQLKSTAHTKESDWMALAKKFEPLVKDDPTRPVRPDVEIKWALLHSFYLHDIKKGREILETIRQKSGVGSTYWGEASLELADIEVLDGNFWKAQLLYGQVDKTFKVDEMGHLAKFKAARLSYFMGQFDWAKAQLDILKSGTTRLIANDAIQLSLCISDNISPDSTYDALKQFSRAELAYFRNQDILAMSILDSLKGGYLSHPIFDDVMYLRANIYERSGDYSQADTLLSLLVSNYPKSILADKSLLNQGILNQERLNNPNKAERLFTRLVIDYPGSIYIHEARRRVRELKSENR